MTDAENCNLDLRALKRKMWVKKVLALFAQLDSSDLSAAGMVFFKTMTAPCTAGTKLLDLPPVRPRGRPLLRGVCC